MAEFEDKGYSVDIHPVENGFIVHRAYRETFRGYPEPIALHEYVFQSFSALCAWLENHFSHRDTEVQSDCEKSVGY